MIVLDPGHTYQPSEIDGETTENVIIFVKREGEGFPGNEGHHAGTNCQEIVRILIDRVKYLHNQIPHSNNIKIINALREVLLQFEQRAAERHGRQLPHLIRDIENIPCCPQCGHIYCEH